MLDDGSGVRVRLDPLALAVILDASSRSSAENGHRVLCSLMGNLSDEHVVHIVDAFPVITTAGKVTSASDGTAEPANDDLVPLKGPYEKLHQLREQGLPNSTDQLMGWGTVGENEFPSLAKVSDFSLAADTKVRFLPRRWLTGPVLIVVTMPNNETRMKVKAYTKSATGHLFREIPLEVKQMSDFPLSLRDIFRGMETSPALSPEKKMKDIWSARILLNGGSTVGSANEQRPTGMSSLACLSEDVDKVLMYIARVLNKEEAAPDADVGRILMNLVSSYPLESLDATTSGDRDSGGGNTGASTSEVQDILLAGLMAELAELQFAISNRLAKQQLSLA